MFQCNQCDLKFVFLYQLIMHRNTHKTVSISLVDENPDQEVNMICDRCSTGFSTHSLYVQHIAKHAAIDNKCSLCSKVFLSIRNLENHIRLHTRETSFHCATCNKSFIRKDRLKKHELIHKSEFSCARCEKTFNSKKALQAHRRSDHEINKSYECTYCTKKYTRNEHLQTHIRSHTSELQHSCQYCGQQFWRNSHLNSHYKIHKISNVSNECACAVCGEFFGTNLLVKHMEDKHKGSEKFQCDICKKRFKQKGNLLYHKKSHQHEENLRLFWPVIIKI